EHPDIPTVAQAGGPAGYEVDTWVSLVAPAGTPPDLVRRLSRDIAAAVADPEVKERFKGIGVDPVSSTPAQLAELAKRDLAAYGDIIKRTGVTAEGGESMSETATVGPETAPVTAGLHYPVDTGVKPVNETFGPNNIRRRVSGEHEVRQMTIRDGRPLADEFDLEIPGFEFVEHKTQVRDFFDAEELKSVYYSEVEALVKKVSRASRVVVFDHTLRSGDEAEREAKLVREPVLNVHNDYTEWSRPQRVRDIMGEKAEALLQRRFAIVQVWRPIASPIKSNPLAIADARSVAPE